MFNFGQHYSCMIIKDHLEELRKQFEDKTHELLTAERQLWQHGNGFLDKQLLDQLAEARSAYQKAESAYQQFVSTIVSKKLNINAEM